MWTSLLALVLSHEVVPAGGVAQCKLRLAEPGSLTAVTVTMEFDAARFGDIRTYAVHSAAGDAHAVARIEGRKLWVSIRAESGTLGALPLQPVLTVDVPVLERVEAGMKLTVEATATNEAAEPVAVEAGSVTVGGVLAVDGVERVNGRMEIRGRGFTEATRVEWDQVAVEEVEFVSANLLRVHLSDAGEPRGKRVLLRNEGAPEVERYYADAPVQVKEETWVSVPQTRSRIGSVFGGSAFHWGGMVVRNTHAHAVDVLLQSRGVIGGLKGEWRMRVEPESTAYLHEGYFPQYLAAVGSDSLEMVGFLGRHPIFDLPPTWMTLRATIPQTVPSQSMSLAPSSVDWSWRPGDALPEPRLLHVQRHRDSALLSPGFDVVVTPANSWLRVKREPLEDYTELAVSADPSGLAPGVYRGSITVVPQATDLIREVDPVVTGVTLTVGPSPVMVEYAMQTLSPSAGYSLGQIGTFTTTVLGNDKQWLRVAVSGGVIRIESDPSRLGKGSHVAAVLVRANGYQGLGFVRQLVQGGAATVVDKAVEFGFYRGALSPARVGVSITSREFAVSAVQTMGGGWLRATRVAGGVALEVNAAGLAAGLYPGIVTVEPSDGSGTVQIPVSLRVAVDPLPGLVASPSHLNLRRCAGCWSSLHTVSLRSSARPQPVVSATSSQPWLTIDSIYNSISGGSVTLKVDPAGLTPGVYTADADVTVGEEFLRIPVTFTVDQALPASGLPHIASLLVGDATAWIFGTGLKAARVFLNGVPATPREATEYSLAVTIPPERIREVRVEYDEWFDYWKLK